jgi:hypothetical protein
VIGENTGRSNRKQKQPDSNRQPTRPYPTQHMPLPYSTTSKPTKGQRPGQGGRAPGDRGSAACESSRGGASRGMSGRDKVGCGLAGEAWQCRPCQQRGEKHTLHGVLLGGVIVLRAPTTCTRTSHVEWKRAVDFARFPQSPMAPCAETSCAQPDTPVAPLVRTTQSTCRQTDCAMLAHAGMASRSHKK